MPPILLKILTSPVQALTWIGGQGARAIAALVFIGVALPPLGELLKPCVAEAIFLLLCISFMRVDVSALRNYLRRPGLVIAATAWTTLAVPAIIGLGAVAVGTDARWPDLFLALMLQGVASPMMASPALAAVMGLDATLVLVTLVTSTSVGLIAFGVFFALTGVSALIFRAAGHERALAVGLMVSQRNMGLMVAATDGLLPGTTWLYFALSQFPIYLSPQLLKPIVRRLTAREAVAAVAKAADA